MSTDSIDVAATPQPKAANEFASLGSIFFKPRATFEAMAERPRFLLAMILVVVVLGALTIPMFQSGIILDQEIAKLEAKGAAQAEIDMMTKVLESQTGLIIGLVSTVVGVPFVLLVSAAITFFMGNFMLGGKIRFPHYVSATAYGAVIGLVDHALRTGLGIARSSMDVRLGLGNLFGEDLPYLGRVLDSMTDPFLLWASAIGALGVGVYAKKGFRFGVLASLPAWIIAILLSGAR